MTTRDLSDLQLSGTGLVSAIEANAEPMLPQGLQPAQAEGGEDTVPPYCPPDVDEFFVTSPWLAEFLHGVARQVCVDVGAVFLLLLGVLGGCIGATRRAQIDDSWGVWPNLYAVLVGISGSARKSPILRFLLRAIRNVEAKLRSQHARALEAYEDELRALKSAERTARGPKPEKPGRCSYLTNSATAEALPKLMGSRARGVLVSHDELSEFFGALGAYSGGARSKDRAAWLRAYDGDAYYADRATSDGAATARLLVSLVGAVQPDVLAGSIQKSDLASGLLARMTPCTPPPQQKIVQARGESVPHRDRYDDLVENLLGLTGQRGGDPDLPPDPVNVDLTDDAHDCWRNWANALHARTFEMLVLGREPDLTAAREKLETMPVRLALILAVIRSVERGQGVQIELTDIQGGILAAEWMAHENERLYALLAKRKPQAPDTLADRVRWIRAKWGEEVRLREFYKRRHVFAEEGEAELEELVKAGLAEWGYERMSEGGGPHPKVLRLRGSKYREQCRETGDTGHIPL